MNAITLGNSDAITPRLRAAVERHGCARIAGRCLVSGHALARALAGLPVKLGTVALLERGLTQLEASEQIDATTNASTK